MAQTEIIIRTFWFANLYNPELISKFAQKYQVIMNKKLYLLIFSLFAALQVSANPITKSEARNVAQEFIGVNDNTDDNVPIAPYYVFSRGEGKG